MRSLKSEQTYYVMDDLELQVHVDDPCAAGPEDRIDWLFGELDKRMAFKRGSTITVERAVRYLGKQ